jgi:RNA polymerase sigma factor (TIGR02999 family)
MNEVTRILSDTKPGDPSVAEKLLPLVYDELRRLARARMANERADHTLDATALVHEAYLRLVGGERFEGRAHFFAAAAEAMRRVLIDHSRNRVRLKRGGGKNRIELDRLTDPGSATDEDLLAFNDSLDRLARKYPQAAEFVKLRFFAGMTLDEAAESMGLSLRTANRQWAFARAWLAAALARD